MKEYSLWKRALSMALAVLLVISLGTPAIAAETEAAQAEEEALKQALAGYMELYPDGGFDFLETQRSEPEGASDITLTVVRKGGTEGSASVTLKALDVSAKYGTDYVIRVRDSLLSETTLEANPNAILLTDLYIDGVFELPEVDTTEPDAAEQEPEEQAAPAAETGLKAAGSAFTGTPSDRPNWREVQDPQTQAEMQALVEPGVEAMKQWASDVEGNAYTLEFAPGEYKKTVTIDLLEDEISETDEQIFFILSDALGAEMGASNTAYLNVLDNDEAEQVVFALLEPEVSANRDAKSVRVTVERISGLEKFASVSIGTAGLSAKPGVDYISSEVELVFPQGVAERTFEVELLTNNEAVGLTQFVIVLDSESAFVQDGASRSVVTLFPASAPVDTAEKADANLMGIEIDTDVYPDDGIAKVSGAGNSTSGKKVYRSNIDLSTADTVTIWWQSNEGSTTTSRQVQEGCDTKTVHDTYNDRKTNVYINDKIVASRTDVFGNTSFTVTLDESMKTTDAKVQLEVVTQGNNVNATAYITNMEVHYPGYTYQIINASGWYDNVKKIPYENNTYVEKIYNVNGVERDANGHRYDFGSPIVLGQAQISRADITSYSNSVTVYRPSEGLKVRHTYQTSNLNSNGVAVQAGPDGNIYLAGYQLQKKGTTNTWSELIKPDDFAFNKTFIDKYKADYLYNNNTFQVRAVYKPYTAWVLFENTDTTKANYANEFKTNELFRMTMLDTIQVTGLATTGFAVENFNLSAHRLVVPHASGQTDNSISANGLKLEQASAETVKKDYVDKATKGRWNPNPNAKFNPALPNVITFSPSGDYTRISMNYTQPMISVKVNPKDNNKDKGIVLYADSDNTKSGDKDQEMVVQPVALNTEYVFNAVPAESDEYKAYWMDFTGDVAPADGELSNDEQEPFKSIGLVRTASNGNVFRYTPKTSKALIYYGFKQIESNEFPGRISGVVKLVEKPIFGGKTTKTPVNGATVSVDEFTRTTAKDPVYKDGYFEIYDARFASGENVTINVLYNGIAKAQTQPVNVATTLEIHADYTFKVQSAKVYRNGVEITPAEINNGDSFFTLEFATTSSIPALTATKAIYTFYDKDDRKLSITDENGGVNGSLVVDNGANTNGFFTLRFNPKVLGIPAGATIKVKFVDQNGVEYYEQKTGILFSKSIGMLSFLASFKSPATTSLQLIGSISSVFDFGWDGDMDDNPNVTTVDDEKTLSFGFSFDYGSAARQRNIAKYDNAKEAAKPDTKVDKSKAAGDANDKSKKATTKVSASGYVNFSFALGIVMAKSALRPGEWYFKEMMLVVEAAGGVSVRLQYTTPIGVPLVVTFGAGVSGEAIFVIQQTYDKREYYFTDVTDEDAPKIDIFNIDMNSATRMLDAYGKFRISPYIQMTAGIGFYIGDITIGGRADFEFNFLTDNTQNNGHVDFTAFIQLTLIIGFTKQWDFASTTVNLFNEGSLFADNYLYDSLDSFEISDRDYLDQRREWNGAADPELMSVQGLTETTMLRGVYPYPDVQLMSYGDGKYIAVFVDDVPARSATNRTAVFYTLYDGTAWSEPQILEDDGTLDDSPCLFDLGEEGILVAWSTADKVFGDDPDMIDVLHSRNIHARLFDKTTRTFGVVQEVTKTSAEDTYADMDPQIAFGVDETTSEKKLIIYYTKSEYSSGISDSGPVIGDVMHPYSLITYRFYDFATGTWRDTYTDTEKANITKGGMSDEDFLQYQDDWYGQGFLSLAPLALVTEKLDAYGYWDTTQDNYCSITAYGGAADPLVIENEVISYNNLALFAYVLDYDSKEETTADRDIFLQIYNFTEKSFSHPIMLTSDSLQDGNLRFVRTGNTTVLGWLSGGAIKAMDISSLVKNNLKQETISGKSFYIINKLPFHETTNPKPFQPPTVAVQPIVPEEAKETASAVTGFDLVSSSDGAGQVYAMWTQRDIKLKDGIQAGTPEAALAENKATETQIYMARFDFAENVITDPIQITKETGANYNQFAFLALPDGSVQAMGVKSGSKIETLNGKEIVTEDTGSRSLTTLRFTTVTDLLLESVDTDAILSNTDNVIRFNLRNGGFDTIKDCTIEVTGEGVSYTPTTLQIVGGRLYQDAFTLSLGKDVKNYAFTVTAKDSNDAVLFSESFEGAIQDQLDVSDFRIDFAGRDALTFSAEIRNNGSAASDPQNFKLSTAGEGSSIVLYTERLPSIGAGESYTILGDFSTNFDQIFVSEELDDGAYQAKASFVAQTESGASAQAELTQYASSEQMGQMNAIDDILVGSGSNVTLPVGGEKKIDARVRFSTLLQSEMQPSGTDYEVVWSSSDESVVKVQGSGYITGVANGIAYLTAEVMPRDNTFESTGNTLMVAVDNYPTLPKEAIRSTRVAVFVGNAGITPQPEEPKPAEPTEPQPVPVFTDVPQQVWYAKAVEQVTSEKLFFGTSGNNFSPDLSMTRAMFVTVLGRLAKVDQTKYEQTNFADVPSGKYFSSYVAWAAEKKITSGVSADQFNPDGSITREQMAVMIARFLRETGQTLPVVQDAIQFTDAKEINPGFAEDIAWIVSYGIMQGKPGNRFDPKGLASRAEVATVFSNLLAALAAKNK